MNDPDESNALVAAEIRLPGPPDPAAAPVLPFGRAIVVPTVAADAGDRAARRFANFFGAIENDNTRAAYQRACSLFFTWCDGRDLALADIEPIHVGAYVKIIGEKFEADRQTKMLFDGLVVGQVVAINPVHVVRGSKHVVKRGKTPVLTADQARALLESIDVSTAVGLSDRALIALMAYSFARVSAAVAMRVEDYYGQGKRWWVRLHEKGGKVHEMPCHHNREAYLDAYLKRPNHGREEDSPVSLRARSHWRADGTGDASVDAWRMIRRRARDAALHAEICCHTFRATGITAYLDNNGTLGWNHWDIFVV